MSVYRFTFKNYDENKRKKKCFYTRIKKEDLILKQKFNIIKAKENGYDIFNKIFRSRMQLIEKKDVICRLKWYFILKIASDILHNNSIMLYMMLNIYHISFK